MVFRDPLQQVEAEAAELRRRLAEAEAERDNWIRIRNEELDRAEKWAAELEAARAALLWIITVLEDPDDWDLCRNFVRILDIATAMLARSTVPLENRDPGDEDGH